MLGAVGQESTPQQATNKNDKEDQAERMLRSSDCVKTSSWKRWQPLSAVYTFNL